MTTAADIPAPPPAAPLTDAERAAVRAKKEKIVAFYGGLIATGATLGYLVIGGRVGALLGAVAGGIGVPLALAATGKDM